MSAEAAPPLQPGEVVVWQGRAAVGAGWPVGVMLGLALLAFCVVLFGGLLLGSGPRVRGEVQELAAIALGFAVVVLAVLTGARLAGPYYVSLTSLAIAGGAFLLFWTRSVARGGPLAPLRRMHGEDLLVFATLVALPLVRVVAGALWTLEVRYVITDRRVLCVRGARTLWQTPRVGLRVERSWRAPGGWLVVGERRLRLRDDDPARVVDAVARG